jgi:GT2 family glycosyltransferase
VTVCSETVPMFIVNYYGLESLGSTFPKVIDKAVENSTYVDNIKVILVDNGSKDRSAECSARKVLGYGNSLKA